MKCLKWSELAGSAGLRKVLCLGLIAASPTLSRAALPPIRGQVGEIVSRPSPAAPETALSAIQRSRDAVKERLAAIAAQADPLAEAVAAYKKEPNPHTAISLLHREAVVAGIGATESEKIAAEADAVAKTCADLAAQCGQQAQALGGDAAKASRAQTDYAAARSTGLNELRELHRSLVERGITNEVMISAPERRQISRLLQLYGASDLAERFLRMESNANQAALNKLNEMADQFTARQHDFADLASAYRLHAASFQTVGGSVGRVAHLIDLNQRFDLESKSAAELQTELGHIDDVLAKTFDSLPDDLSAAFGSSGTVERNPGPTGVWDRLLRILGLGGNTKSKTPETAMDTP